jgi:hypothetical protein
VAAGDRAYWADLANTINPPVVRLIQQAVQSMASATAAPITYAAGSEDADTHNYHDTVTNNTRITPTVAGWYLYTCTFSVASASFTQLATGIRKNGANYTPLVVLRPDAASAAANSMQCVGRVPVNGSTDYLEHIGQQNSAGAVNTNITANSQCIFELHYLRPL